MPACKVCGTRFQPRRNGKKTLCGDPNCTAEWGRRCNPPQPRTAQRRRERSQQWMRDHKDEFNAKRREKRRQQRRARGAPVPAPPRSTPERRAARSEKQAKRRLSHDGHLKRLAHKAVEAEVAKGTLRQEKCRRCSNTDTVAHHFDYRRPTTAIWWLCRPCHNWLHHASLQAGTM